jgi:glutamine synthetase type III
VPPDFSPLVFFFKQLLLAPVDKPSDDLDFFRFFEDIFDFSVASPVHRRCIAGASPVHRRCIAGASPVSLTPAKQTILL